jgi:hypothetical protein
MNVSLYLLAALAIFLQACSSSDTPLRVDSDDSDDDVDSAEVDDGPIDAGKLDSGRTPLDARMPPSSDGGDAGSKDGGSRDSAIADAASDAAVPEGEFATCVAALKPVCNYDEKETACASIRSQKIPLTSGGTASGTAVAGGPHGAIVNFNQGKQFANTPSFLEGTCDVLAASFGEPESVTADILDLRGADLSLYTVFRPACMRDGETYPVITWGNGTCGQTGGYGVQLAVLASHGFVVIASNSRFTDGGKNEMLRALDFAKAANADSTSPLYQRLDLTKVGAMGHSQGASATANAARDARIKAIILWNGGTSGQPAKPFLSVTGDRDIGNPTVASLSSFVNGATQPGAWLFYHQVLETGGSVTGHLTLMEQPERVTDVTVNWWKYILNDDAEAKSWFVGTDCMLCKEKTAFEYGQHNLK